MAWSHAAVQWVLSPLCQHPRECFTWQAARQTYLRKEIQQQLHWAAQVFKANPRDGLACPLRARQFHDSGLFQRTPARGTSKHLWINKTHHQTVSIQRQIIHTGWQTVAVESWQPWHKDCFLLLSYKTSQHKILLFLPQRTRCFQNAVAFLYQITSCIHEIVANHIWKTFT